MIDATVTISYEELKRLESLKYEALQFKRLKDELEHYIIYEDESLKNSYVEDNQDFMATVLRYID